MASEFAKEFAELERGREELAESICSSASVSAAKMRWYGLLMSDSGLGVLEETARSGGIAVVLPRPFDSNR